MATRKSLNTISQEFSEKVERAGDFWFDVQPADMGNYSGVVQVPGKPSMVYVRLSNGQVVQVFNNVAPNIYNWKVKVGKSKSQPGLVQVVEVRWVYNSALMASYILFHHKQHEYPAPDTVWIRRDQFMPLLVLPNGGLTIKLFGDVVYSPTMTNPLKVNDQTFDMTSYIPGFGAKYYLMEITSTGSVNFVAGATADTVASLTVGQPIPAPTPGSFPICALILYAGQTAIRRDSTVRDIIDLRMFTSDAAQTTGTQIQVATETYTLAQRDFIGYTRYADGGLRKITVKNFLKPVYEYINQIYAVLKALISGSISAGTAAGGDLGGTYPNPTVIKIGGVAVTVDTDGTLAANSDAKLATQKAVKTYVDGHSASGGVQLVMQPGVSSPPVPVENTDGTDWVYYSV